MYLKLLALALVIVCGLVGWKAYNLHTAYDKLQSVSYNQYVGAESPAVVLVEVMDYRCSFCRMMDDTVTEFITLNPDVRVVYRMFPVFKDPSIREAKLAMAAGRQGKFREMHQKLIHRDDPVTDKDVEAYIAELGLDKEKLNKDMIQWEITQELLNTVDAADALGIKGTPTFVIGKTVYTPQSGLPTVEDLKKIVDAHRPGAAQKTDSPGK